MKVLACQIEIPEITTAAQRSSFLDDTIEKISAKQAQEPADLVVLPELSSIEYSRRAFDNLDQLSEDLDGHSFEVFGRAARELSVAICYGIPRIGDEGFHISQVVVDANGSRVGHFDKMHIAHYGASPEKDYFTRGRHVFLFEIAGIRMAPIICYDIRIPELARMLCVDYGVELILHCGAYFVDRSYYSWRHFVVTRALENQAYMLSLNRAGDDYGSSIFCPPWVDETAPEIMLPKEETFASFEIDRARIVEARKTYSFLEDRLPDYRRLDVRDGRSAATKPDTD
ncbi:MAG: carbon-nitrogen hydrolase family protein [Alphaproteobacteria bacterium]|nr:carbon-nitrogen hydrolase family protein [Alphaproteobacteria bacterium]